MTKLTTRESSSTRLTDTQLIVLSRAAQREDGAAALSEGMTEKAAQKLAAALVRRQLVREIRAKPGMPVWRRGEKGRSHALIITKLGRTAIKAEDEGESVASCRNSRLLAKVVAGRPQERLDFAPHESNVVCDGAPS